MRFPQRDVERHSVMENSRRGRRWHVRQATLSDANPTVDRSVAADMTPEQRVARVWELVLRFGEMTGVDYQQQRLQRSVVRVFREPR